MFDRSNSSAAVKSDPLPAVFYAVGADHPTVSAFPRSPFHAWSALSAALANHFGTDAQNFYTDEVYWNRDREFAEVVKLDGRIVGALDRPISAADIAEIESAGSMEKRAFINRIRSLFNIDGCALPELTREQQSQFVSDPLRYFLNADDAQSDVIMREVESRQKDAAPFRALKEVAKTPPAAKKPPRPKKAKPRVDGQRELLLPIPGKGEGKTPAQAPATRRKAG